MIKSKGTPFLVSASFTMETFTAIIAAAREPYVVAPYYVSSCDKDLYTSYPDTASKPVALHGVSSSFPFYG
jgi:hypothetical protein